MEHCPTCGARYREGMVCFRCQTDLSQVLAVERLAREGAQQARQALRRGQTQQAQVQARRAGELHRTAETVQVLALAALTARDYPAALLLWREYRQLRRAGEE